jgi:hypothetical protein
VVIDMVLVCFRPSWLSLIVGLCGTGDIGSRFMDPGDRFARFRFYRWVFETNAFLSLSGRPVVGFFTGLYSF